jgi:hypothetical protein
VNVLQRRSVLRCHGLILQAFQPLGDPLKVRRRHQLTMAPERAASNFALAETDLAFG